MPSELAKQAGTIYDLLKRGATLEAQESIMELRQTLLGIGEENLALRARIHELEERDALQFDGTVYWHTLPEKTDFWRKDPNNGPFCSRCHDADSKRIRLLDQRSTGYTPSGWYCPVCKKTF